VNLLDGLPETRGVIRRADIWQVQKAKFMMERGEGIRRGFRWVVLGISRTSAEKDQTALGHRGTARNAGVRKSSPSQSNSLSLVGKMEKQSRSLGNRRPKNE